MKSNMNEMIHNKSKSLTVDDINDIILEMCYKLETFDGYCPPTVSKINDHVTCWHATPPGTVAKAECPKLEFFDTSNFVYKKCWPNGTWFDHPDNSDNWTQWANYTSCVDFESWEFTNFLNELFVIGYSISLVALIISVVIFNMLPSLSCTRIRIHIQLFISFILNNTVWIVWYLLVIPNSQNFMVDNSNFWCQVVEILRRYFLFANYMWMFCEGLYLHISLVVVFVRNELAWEWFVLIGWGVPVPVIFTYCAVRIFYYRDTERCWISESNAEIIYRVPVYITLAASIIFLINVLRVIINIIEPNSPNPSPARVKKALRAACILIPLFGLQFIVLPFRPAKHAPIYDYITVVLTTGQGLCVSCLFCFANKDVNHAINGYVNRRLYASRWGNYINAGNVESGVTTAQHTNSIRML